jgi:hypothetical protein
MLTKGGRKAKDDGILERRMDQFMVHLNVHPLERHKTNENETKGI